METETKSCHISFKGAQLSAQIQAWRFSTNFSLILQAVYNIFTALIPC